MSRTSGATTLKRMGCFLVGISVPQWDAVDIERAKRTLLAAESRISEADSPRVTAVTHDDGRLICMVEAASVDAVRRLTALALLPAGRVQEVRDPDGPGSRGASDGC